MHPLCCHPMKLRACAVASVSRLKRTRARASRNPTRSAVGDVGGLVHHRRGGHPKPGSRSKRYRFADIARWTAAVPTAGGWRTAGLLWGAAVGNTTRVPSFVGSGSRCLGQVMTATFVKVYPRSTTHSSAADTNKLASGVSGTVACNALCCFCYAIVTHYLTPQKRIRPSPPLWRLLTKLAHQPYPLIFSTRPIALDRRCYREQQITHCYHR